MEQPKIRSRRTGISAGSQANSSSRPARREGEPGLALLSSALLLASMCGPAAALTVSGAALVEGGTLPLAHVASGFGCHGANRVPALSWSGVPKGAQSLAVTMFDPDAGAKGFWHWALVDLPPGLRALSPGAVPASARPGRNDFGTIGYGGACPPKGSPPHRYLVTLWAMPERHLPFGTGSRDALVGAYLARHALARASLTLRYGR